MRSKLLAFFAVLGVTAACGWPGGDDDPFREDVLHCEEGLGRLAECCPTAAVDELRCDHAQAGCSGRDGVSPDLDLETSACLRGLSCDEVRAADICARAANLGHDAGAGRICP